ncbi:hypothetical protein [Paludibacterium denitrificans]|uniref:hypothetical protein n=1 Tax=Paludibacterium denitrificans TaxID=2675226 RepID=UPI001E3FB4DD|nr:hypothetical protein [Paludibacterium denitrificans]
MAEFKELNPGFNLPVYAYKPGRQMLLLSQQGGPLRSQSGKMEQAAADLAGVYPH